jgi:putative aminopeptidase FrvX
VTTYDDLFNKIEAYVMCHSPSGVEGEMDALIFKQFADLGLDVIQDKAGNIIAKIPGTDGTSIAITAHKDEIGAIVTGVESDGRVKLKKFSGAFPWIYGEGPIDMIGDNATVTGILSFGSRHISNLSPVQFGERNDKPVLWENVWVETKQSAEALVRAGVRVGTRVVIGKHRKKPIRLGDYIGSYTLDDKASVVVLMELAAKLRNPGPDVYLVVSSREEIGGYGALYFAKHYDVDAMIALEIAPAAPEYPLKTTEAPALMVEDSASLYDEDLIKVIGAAARKIDVPLQYTMASSFGSDASLAMKAGHLAKGACLGFAADNSHGYEITHIGAIENCFNICYEICQGHYLSKA